MSVRVNDNAAALRHNYNSIEDEQLLNLIGIKQDREALAELYQRYRAPVGRFLVRAARETKLIEEIYNDVMLTIWRKADGFRGESKASTWIFAIAYRVRLAHTRKENKHGNIDQYVMPQETEPEITILLNETIQDAMVKLSDQHRTVIELTYFHGYRTAEVAAILDCPQNTVKTRLFHARKKLKVTIENDQSMLRTNL